MLSKTKKKIGRICGSSSRFIARNKWTSTAVWADDNAEFALRNLNGKVLCNDVLVHNLGFTDSCQVEMDGMRCHSVGGGGPFFSARVIK